MIGAKEIPLLCLIVGACALVFGLSCLPGIITNDAISHEIDPSKAMMFNGDGSVKKSFWSLDSMVGGSDSGAYQPAPVKEGDMQANPFMQ